MVTVIDNLERRVDADRQKRRNTKSYNSFGAAEPMPSISATVSRAAASGRQRMTMSESLSASARADAS